MKITLRVGKLLKNIFQRGLSTYLHQIAHIFCEEFQYDKDDIIEVSMSDDGNTVWVHFDSGTIGFASELLWDKNVRETFRKNYEI